MLLGSFEQTEKEVTTIYQFWQSWCLAIGKMRILTRIWKNLGDIKEASGGIEVLLGIFRQFPVWISLYADSKSFAK